MDFSDPSHPSNPFGLTHPLSPNNPMGINNPNSPYNTSSKHDPNDHSLAMSPESEGMFAICLMTGLIVFVAWFMWSTRKGK
jgi:hypothetical protein